MAQVKLIETEQPQQFKPVTIQITFETQEEVNAMRSVMGLHSSAWKAICDNPFFYGKSTIKDFEEVSIGLFYALEPLCK